MQRLEDFVITNIVDTLLTEDQQLVYKLEDGALVELPLEDIKLNLSIIIKSIFEDRKQTLIADTGLGYNVDATMNDLQLFEIGKELNLEYIKDADNVMHVATVEAYEAILHSIKVRGLMLMQTKWTHLDVIESMTTIDETKTYVSDILRTIDW